MTDISIKARAAELIDLCRVDGSYCLVQDLPQQAVQRSFTTLIDELLKAYQTGDLPIMVMELLWLPVIGQRYGLKLNRKPWRKLDAIVGKSITQSSTVELFTIRLFISALATDVQTATVAYLNALSATEVLNRLDETNIKTGKLFRAIGQTLNDSGWLSLVGDARSIRSIEIVFYNVVKSNSIEFIYTYTRIAILVLHFKPNASRAFLDVIFSDLISPLLRLLSVSLSKKSQSFFSQLNFLMHLEALVFQSYLRVEESPEHFLLSVEPFLAPMQVAGRTFHKNYSGLYKRVPRKNKKVGFLLHSSVMLAHTDVFLSYLTALTEVNCNSIRPIVYVLDGSSFPGSRLENCLKETTATVRINLNPEPANMTQYLHWLDQSCREDEIEAMVHVSHVQLMALFSSARIAPVHIWWSMKYHSLELSEIDGYLANGTLQTSKKIGSRQWRVCHSALPPLVDQNLRWEAERIRSDLKKSEETIIVGCLGREEKLIDPLHVEALSKVLKSNTNALYVWSGRTELKMFVDQLRDHGIREQCHYIGWVNTKLWAHILDIYLDSFPFASGITAFESMALGKPEVVLKTPESLESSTALHMVPVFERRVGTLKDQERVTEIFAPFGTQKIFPIVDTVDEYVHRATVLIQNSEYRAACGAACRSFVEEFMLDEERYALSVTDHILNVIAECSAVS